MYQHGCQSIPFAVISEYTPQKQPAKQTDPQKHKIAAHQSVTLHSSGADGLLFYFHTWEHYWVVMGPHEQKAEPRGTAT